MRLSVRAALLAAGPTILPATAWAHTGLGDAGGFLHGALHPFGGLDHVLAMVAVGVFAACLGGRALLLVPASFVAMMAVGGALGMSGFELPFVEAGIAASVVVLGLVVAFGWNTPLAVAMALAGFFAIFHGYAHGAEMPATSSSLTYALGFMLATALLHLAGIGLGIATVGARSHLARRIAGGAAALAGVGLLTGTI